MKLNSYGCVAFFVLAFVVLVLAFSFWQAVAIFVAMVLMSLKFEYYE